jgi:peptidoglycan/LPS O-acetylase OafA/YrhL
MPTERSGTESEQARTTRRNPGLDGLRGLAVTLVVVFHVYPGLLPGGFLGVDVFFVLSGYLITGLLLRRFSEDAPAHGRRAGPAPSRPWRTLRAFWISRFRRLFPELATVLLAVSIAACFAGPEFGSGLRAQVAAALVSCTNWLLIAHGQNYFAAFAAAAGHPPAPALQHLWSLAVEEQFYLVWPPVLWTLLRLTGRNRLIRHRLGLTILLALAACGSFTLMADKSGTGSSDYYNTLTHCGGLLAGAATALVLPLDRISRAASARFTRVVGGLGLGGLVVIVVLSICLNGDTTAPERGGIAFASLAALPVLLAAACPGTDVARMLTWRPAVFLGERSYGVYLWHWPLIVLLGSPASAPGMRAAALRGVTELCLPILLASLSRRYIAAPARTLARADVAAAWERLVGRTAHPWPLRAAAALAAFALLPAFIGLSRAPSVDPDQSALQAQISAGSAIAAASTARQRPGSAAALERGLQAAAPHLPALPPSGTPEPALGGQVTAIGDSVLLASAQALVARLPGIVIDAKVGRQIWDAPDQLESLAEEGLLRHYVVVALGTNGAFQQATLDEIRDEIGPERVLVLVTVHMPRPWQGPVNSGLTRYAAAHPGNTLLVNWNSTISPYPGLLWPDATHPRPSGAQVYADLLAAGLGSRAHE